MIKTLSQLTLPCKKQTTRIPTKRRRKMINTTPISILICLLLPLTTTTMAQPTPPTSTPPPSNPLSPAPAKAKPPTPPPSIKKILQKSKGFSRFLGLMTRTQVSNRLETELNDPKKNQGVTIFALRNKAFSGMKSGALNSLSSDQLSKLVLFHCVPSFLTLTDFQAVTNPLITEAGDSTNGAFTLNITTTGNQINFTTGVGRDEDTVLGTVYSNSDQLLAVYEVSRMLLPMAIFPVPPFVEAPAPAPGQAKADGKKKDDGGGGGDGSSSDGGSDKGSSSGGGGGSKNDSSSGGCHGGRGYGGVVSLVVGVLVVLI